jgi:hypothetical protein
MPNTSATEARIRRLEDLIKALLGRQASTEHKLGAVAQDDQQKANDLQEDAIFDALNSSTFALGSGPAVLLDEIDGILYNTGLAITVYNNTGGSIPANATMYVAFRKGKFRVVEANCTTLGVMAPTSPETYTPPDDGG